MFDLYKVLTISEWDESVKSGLIETSLDNKDGFIHFSSSTQLALTLDLYFKSDDKVILLQIDEEKLDSPLVYEEADGNRIGKFPHLYDKKPLLHQLAFQFAKQSFLLFPHLH